MDAKDIIVAFFGAAVGLAGILLVFVGFIYAHSETIDLENDRKKYQYVAKVGMIPFLTVLLSAAFCIRWMFYPSTRLVCLSAYSFCFGMGLTALYGLVAFLFYL